MMGRNIPKGLEAGSVMDWRKVKDEDRSIIMRRKRGRIPGSCDFDESNARTPFEALRYRLKLTRKEWAECLGYSVSAVGMLESGENVGGVALGKRVQEEARRRGIAVTLDELYQHVIPYGMEDEFIVKEEREG